MGGAGVEERCGDFLLIHDGSCAVDDAAAHAAYSTYAILGEHLKSWFRFISPTGLANGLHKLADYKLLYVPRMRYTDPALTAELVAFMKDGGTIVTFDPDFLKFNIDGTTPPERKMIPSLVPRRNNDAALLFKGRKLPLSKVLHLELPENGTVYAYDFQNLPENVNVMAAYTDKKPAMVEIPVGKGRLIYSTVMPFGSSDIVLNPGSWVEFFAETAKSAGEKTGLPIWDFELAEQPGGRIELAPPGI